ncbi:MAG TPA: hypothetical protein VMV69_00650 [Pirellulales bacterium]|nr:hypothetical protein [Pirellulales bacterium]
MASMHRGKPAAASTHSDEFSPWRAGLTLMVLTVVTTGITLANLSSQPVHLDCLLNASGRPWERPFGWPLTWYWRGKAQLAFAWPISRFLVWRLVANSAAWLFLLLSAAAACRWLLRRYRPRLRWRMRATTLLVLTPLAAVIVLANLPVPDRGMEPGEEVQFGWPLLWYWRFECLVFDDWDYNTLALAGNLMLWLLMAVLSAIAWEWLIRRYRPRFQWSVRGMLALVAAAAVVSAWCRGVYHRAEIQDPLIDMEMDMGDLCIQRWGPEWLDIVGADRFRRRIVGAEVTSFGNREEQLMRLAQLRDVRFLSFDPLGAPISPAMRAALGRMHRVRMLEIEFEDGRTAPGDWREYLATIGGMNHLEWLRLTAWDANAPDLRCLAGLRDLKSLILIVMPYGSPDGGHQTLVQSGELRTLAYLPPLPRLESLVLRDGELGDQDLRALANFPRLKWLELSATSVTGAGLAKLAAMESLEELAINEDMATEEGFESLARFRRLKAVHVAGRDADPFARPPTRQESNDRADFAENRADSIGGARPARLALDDGYELMVMPDKLEGVRRALAALRNSRPGIVIDAYDEFHEGRALNPLGFFDEPLSSFLRDRYN